MPLLENAAKRDILAGRGEIKPDPEDPHLGHPFAPVGYQQLPATAAMFAHSLMASHLMATVANPVFFHPTLLPMGWPAGSPPSPPASNEQLSPSQHPKRAAAANNNNNNVVTSSTADTKKRKWKTEDDNASVCSASSLPLSSPTSSISPPGDGKEPNRDKQFTCGVCNRSFGYKHVLQNHERTHTGEKPFECPECHKRFTRDHHLKTHMRLHTGERPYHCEHCERQFVQVANLRRHLRVHTGERPYCCEHCTAKFSDSNQLKAHLLIHTNEKPFSCEKCHARFRRRHHVLHHKCGGSVEKEMTPDSDELEEETRRRRVMHAPTSPLIVLPLQVDLPEQTEPEDLSMSTGLNSNSSGSPRSRSPSLEEEEGDSHESAIYLGKRPKH